ncbi:hypothetical protein [Ralstonia phage RP31]|uniref:Uncharacterized protein n=2 Tax=Ripduovirus RP12 TaxID=2560700 RepID=A0A1L7N1N8_9CAUD|nr:hypothetical protein FDH28_gp211 [Ralstonia phage RP12]BAW19184.1 hypothetical protein [Ralstonia phage RP12]BAW19470.1 hypothetical protein [Ralstonia phage RP31]
MNDKSKMPWDDLIWVFLRNAPRRIEQIEQSLIKDPLSQLREFRVLTIGGPRQSGKTDAVMHIVKKHSGARLMGGWVIGSHGKTRQVEVPAEKSLELHELVPEKLKDVKTLVIESDFTAHSFNYYGAVEEVYATHPEWFHPEFSIIHVLCPVNDNRRAMPRAFTGLSKPANSCYCNDDISLQMVSGGAAPDGLYGEVTLKIGETYVEYVRKTEAITFDDFVEYGKSHGANIVNDMPWSFQYKGRPVTHENDNLYLIAQGNETLRFSSDDLLVTGKDGLLSVIPKDKEGGWFLPRSAINDLMQASVDRLIDRAKRAHFTNVDVRINGQNEIFEADWIKRMFPVAYAPGLVKPETPISRTAAENSAEKQHAAAGVEQEQ